MTLPVTDSMLAPWSDPRPLFVGAEQTEPNGSHTYLLLDDVVVAEIDPQGLLPVDRRLALAMHLAERHNDRRDTANE